MPNPFPATIEMFARGDAAKITLNPTAVNYYQVWVSESVSLGEIFDIGNEHNNPGSRHTIINATYGRQILANR